MGTMADRDANQNLITGHIQLSASMQHGISLTTFSIFTMGHYRSWLWAFLAVYRRTCPEVERQPAWMTICFVVEVDLQSFTL